MIMIAKPIYTLFSLIFPQQQNLFAFYVQKYSPEQGLHPWLTLSESGIKFNHDWARIFYK
jgi:hypothetical protein